VLASERPHRWLSMQAPGFQFALVAFDTDRIFDRDAVERLERTLQISERWSIGTGVKVRLAVIAEGPRSSVCIASVANVPASQSDPLLTGQIEGALRQVGKDIINGIWVRNVAIVALDSSLKPLAESANALRTLIEQVREPADRFGKILRIFLPGSAGQEPSTDDWRYAAERLRVQLRQHAAELARETSRSSVAYVEPAPESVQAASLESKLLDALTQLTQPGQPPAVQALAREIGTLHMALIRHCSELVSTNQILQPKVEELGRLSRGRAPAEVSDRLMRYSDQVLKPMAELQRILG
jgi:hypothetical protein